MKKLNMKKLIKYSAATFCVMAALAIEGKVQAQQSDALLDKLVEKGLLTVKEAQQLREESDKDFTKALSAKTGMPDWVSSLTWKGDLRLRYDQNRGAGDTDQARTRYRFRFRYGAEAVIADDFAVGFRFASGGTGDPISTNQSMNDNADKKALALDLAYASWTPINNKSLLFTLIGGKMENPFNRSDLRFSDSIFDSDYTPEGIAAVLGWNLSNQHKLTLGGGLFILDEHSTTSEDEPYLIVYKAQFNSEWNKTVSSTIGAGGYGLNNRGGFNGKGGLDKNESGGQVISQSGTGYSPIIVDASLTYTLESFPLYNAPFPITVAGEFIKNPQAAAGQDTGSSVGITFGKSGKKGLWDIGYRYKSLQADSVWEDVNDSDFGSYLTTAYKTGTGNRGHIFQLQYNISDAVNLSAKYFLTERISADSGLDSHRVQLDMIWKF